MAHRLSRVVRPGYCDYNRRMGGRQNQSKNDRAGSQRKDIRENENMAKMGYMLEQGKIFDTVESLIEYLYGLEQGERETVMEHCVGDGEFKAWMRRMADTDAVRRWEDSLEESASAQKRYVDTLCLLEQAAPSKRRSLLNLCAQFLKNLPEYWLLQHTDLYLASGKVGGDILARKDSLESGGTGTEDFKNLTDQLGDWMESLEEAMMDNYLLYENGFFLPGKYSIFGKHIDGYFVDDGGGRKVPVGYLKEKGRIQAKHCLEKGMEKQREEAAAAVESYRTRAGYVQEQLETMRQSIKTTYKRPGRIRSVIAMFMAVMAAIWAGSLFAGGNLEGILSKGLGGFLLFMSLMTFLSGLKGFRRCGAWSRLNRCVKEVKELIGRADALKEKVSSESMFWEQRGAINRLTFFPMERDGQIREQASLLEEKLKKKASPFTWTILLLLSYSALGAVLPTAAGMDSVAGSNEEVRLNVRTVDDVDWDQTEQVSVEMGASSSLVSQTSGMVYGPERMLDGDVSTSWQEGEDGFGEGVTLSASFYGETVPLKVISFYGGSWKSEEAFWENGRPSSLKVVCSREGEEMGTFSVELEDGMQPAYLEFSRPVLCDSLEIQIESVYPGSRYEDTAVTEMAYYQET